MIARITNVNVVRKGNIILEDVNFSLADAEFCYLIGRTGSGKSSLLKLLYGEYGISSGTATVAGTKLSSLTPNNIHLYRRQLGMVFQDYSLFEDWSVSDNLAFVLKATEWEDKLAIDNRIQEVLAEVMLLDKLKMMVSELSGGEKQRLAIGRALLNHPKLLIADEPTGNLDPDSSKSIMQLLKKLTMQHGMASIVATHDYEIIKHFPARILECKDGRLIG